VKILKYQNINKIKLVPEQLLLLSCSGVERNFSDKILTHVRRKGEEND